MTKRSKTVLLERTIGLFTFEMVVGDTSGGFDATETSVEYWIHQFEREDDIENGDSTGSVLLERHDFLAALRLLSMDCK